MDTESDTDSKPESPLEGAAPADGPASGKEEAIAPVATPAEKAPAETSAETTQATPATAEAVKAAAKEAAAMSPPPRARRELPPELAGETAAPEYVEKVVFINRCAKVVKGGRRFSFSALVVSGDQDGKVGFGFGKAKEVAECIRKASESSKSNMIGVAIKENTIPHEVIGEYGGGRVLLRPASPGTGIIAGGGVRAVVEAAGIKDILGKSMGSKNQANVVKATLEALKSLRTRSEIYKLRGKKAAERKAI